MASAVTPEKIICDINDCVADLQKEFLETSTPVNDDNTTLHRFCTKLEFILQNGMKEKSSLLGSKKGYWNYFCLCLASSKGIHDGLKYVKSLPELQTPLGKGRAFIRFCLMHHCLADALQNCFMEAKITSVWYHDRSVPSQAKLWTPLITQLYELNDINFDLSPRAEDLDVSWPTFARKLFLSSQAWRPPSRSMSISSLLSITSQNDSGLPLQSPNECSSPDSRNEVEHLHEELARSEAARCDLQKKLEMYQKSEDEFRNFRMHFENKSKELDEKWKHVEEVLKAKLSGSSEDVIKAQNEMLSHACDEKVKQLNEQWQNKEKDLLEKELKLKLQLKTLEDEKGELLRKVSTLQDDLSNSQLSVKEFNETVLKLQCDNDVLQKENQRLRDLSEKLNSGDTVHKEMGFDVCQKIKELTTKLESNDKALLQMVSNKQEMDNKFHQIQEVNSNLRDLASTVEQANGRLTEEILSLKGDLQSSKLQLTKTEELNEYLKSRLSEFQEHSVDLVPPMLNSGKADAVEIDLQSDFKSLLLQMKDVMMDLQNQYKVSNEEPFVLPYLLKLKKIREAFEVNLAEENKRLKEGEVKKQQIEKNIAHVKKLALKQEDIVNSLQNKLECSLKENRLLNSQLCVLRDMLQFHFASGVPKNNNGSKQSSGVGTSNVDSAVQSADSSSSSITESVDNETEFDLSGGDISSLISIIESTLGKLEKLTTQVEKLQTELESSYSLNENLISKVQDQEIQLRGITKELEAAQNLVSILKKEHNKLQSGEDILKYELQEKRKLLTRLKRQLESTREEWNRVRQKNYESETEWKILRKEFVQRHKQASEESDIVDEKISEELPDSSKFQKSETSPDFESFPTNQSAASSSSADVSSDEMLPTKPSKSRLEILEEQCQLLYSSLLQGSKKSENLNRRLEAMHKGPLKRVGNAGRSSTKQSDDNIDPDLHLSEDQNHEESDLSLSPEMDERRVTGETFSCEHLHTTDNPVPTVGSYSPVNCDAFVDDSVVDNSSKSDYCDVDFSSEGASGVGNINLNKSPSSSCLVSNEVGSIFSPINAEVEMTKNCQDESLGVSTKQLTVYKDDTSYSPAISQNALSSSGHLGTEQQPVLAREADLQAHLESSQQVNKVLEQKLESLQKQNTYILSKENDLRKRADFILRKERTEFNDQVTKLKGEKEALLKQVSSLEQLSKVTETDLQHARHQLYLNTTTMEQEIAALQLQLTAEALKYERALKLYSEQESGLSEMKSKVCEQEHLILSLEEALAEIKDERESEKEHQWHELEELQVALITRDEECISLNDELRKSYAVLDEETKRRTLLETQLAEMKVASQNVIGALEEELAQLRADSRELRKKLIKVIKEKDALWKRTDHLSYLQRIQVADRWMNDNEAHHCLGCKNRFTFLLRKHHCRLCGRIFCHACANNWLLTACSSRRTRVCNECYIQHLQLEKEVRKGSDIPTLNEDSEEEEAVPDCSSHNPLFSSFDSEIPSIMSNSMMSLPVKGTESADCSPHLFASAPDLRWYSPKHEDKSVSAPKYIYKRNSILEEDVDKAHDFDVISDEEIAKSLSTSSPYNPFVTERVQPDNSADSGVSLTLTRTTQEIKAAGENGISGEVWVNAGMSCGIPVLCEDPPVTLCWSFASDPMALSFSLVFQESIDAKSQKSLLSCSQPKNEDSQELQKSGLYILLFNNSFSRVMARKVQYTLWVKQQEEEEEAVLSN